MYKKYIIEYKLVVSGGEKGLSGFQLTKEYPNEKFADKAVFDGYKLTFYTNKTKGTKEFYRDLNKFKTSYLYYIHDNLDKFMTVHTDVNFQPPVEFVIDPKTGCKCYGVGCIGLLENVD